MHLSKKNIFPALKKKHLITQDIIIILMYFILSCFLGGSSRWETTYTRSNSFTAFMNRPEKTFFYDEKKKGGLFFLTYFGLHASEPHSGLCAESDGLLVSGVEDVNQLGVVSARRAVIES